MKFENLGLSDAILKALEKEGYEEASPIQEQAIPFVLEGRDVLACAQTGTGKTAAFAAPILHLLSNKSNNTGKIRSLILTPTRELAIQIKESFDSYGCFLNLKSYVIFGGVKENPQIDRLKQGVDILIATPGRLKDFLRRGLVNLKDIEIFVLDEADRMLDMGFITDVKKIISYLPQEKQTLFFSATMPTEIIKLVNSLLKDPANIKVTPVSSTVESINQLLYFVDKDNKRKLLIHLLQDKSITSALVFSRTKHGANNIAQELMKNDITAMAIHGNKSQNARQLALSRFKTGEIRVLVASDIAARGIDIDELSHVVNFDLPNIPETYVHRIGRTGRAGLTGTAISFCCIDEKEFLLDIQKLIKKTIEVAGQNPYPMNVFELSPKKDTSRQGRQGSSPRGPKPDARRSNSAKPTSRAKTQEGKNQVKAKPSTDKIVFKNGVYVQPSVKKPDEKKSHGKKFENNKPFEKRHDAKKPYENKSDNKKPFEKRYDAKKSYENKSDNKKTDENKPEEKKYYGNKFDPRKTGKPTGFASSRPSSSKSYGKKPTAKPYAKKVSPSKKGV